MAESPGSTPPAATAREPLKSGAHIGRYLVLSMVGKGGMGDVYAAYDPELDRKVAIKLLRVRGEKSEASEGRSRLMREAQAIAKLSHPNVVVVYDVGTFEGQVFMAMEFIDGHTLSYWMHAASRTWMEILKVFGQAGQGLTAAHEKDVVHRDFKPDNVMLTAEGQLRVMDFGLARVVVGSDRTSPGDVSRTRVPTADDLASTGRLPAPALAAPAQPSEAPGPAAVDLDQTRELSRSNLPVPPRSPSSGGSPNLELTETGSTLGTPAYMSPEQFNGQPTDARTDQFSFCVALYEALYGERPFSGNTLPALTESVTEGRVRQPPAASEVPGWLRDIVLRGLSALPDQRWPSMRALLRELEKKGEQAQRLDFDSGAHAKLAGIWDAPVRGRSVESVARAEMRRAFLATGKRYAEVAFETTTRILDRYAEDWAAMYTDACQATHVRGEQSTEVLDLRIACLHEALESLKALTRAFRAANGEVVENAVNAADALPSIARAGDVKALRAVVRPPEEAAIRAAVAQLRTELAEVRVACTVGRLNQGLKAIGSLEAIARNLGYAPLLAEVLLERGRLENERRDPGAAAAFEEALWTAELSRHDEVAAEAAVTLVYVVGDNENRFDAGEIWSRHAEMLLRRLGGHDRLWGWLHNNRGAMRSKQGRLAEGLEDQRRAVVAKEKAAGAESADVALSLANIALVLQQMGDATEAAPYAERGLALLEAGIGPQHPRTALVRSNFAEILNELGRFAEAKSMARSAIDAVEGEVDPGGLFIAFPLMALARGHLGANEPGEALPILERVAGIYTGSTAASALSGEVHFALARAIHGTGGAPERARALATRARADYAGSPLVPATVRAIAEIDAWLAAFAAP